MYMTACYWWHKWEVLNHPVVGSVSRKRWIEIGWGLKLMPMLITSLKFMLVPIKERPKPGQKICNLLHNMHMQFANSNVGCRWRVPRGDDWNFVHTSSPADKRRIPCARCWMHARVASSGCGAVGTLSDDPSLGEAVIDAFWPDWPTDCSMMMIIPRFPKLWSQLTYLHTVTSRSKIFYFPHHQCCIFCNLMLVVLLAQHGALYVMVYH